MKTLVLMIAAALFVAVDVSAATATVIKVQTGNCSGSNTTFKKKEWVDLNDDGKADYIVTTWCNNNVSVGKALIVSGTWPSNWTAEMDYHTVASNGAHHFRFTYKDVVNNTTLGTETTDSTSPGTASMVFYSFIYAKPTVSDPLNQEPAGSVEIPTQVELSPAVAKLNFESYESGNHEVTVTIRENGNRDRQVKLAVNVGGAGRVTVPFIVPEGATVMGFTITRPGERQQHDYISHD